VSSNSFWGPSIIGDVPGTRFTCCNGTCFNQDPAFVGGTTVPDHYMVPSNSRAVDSGAATPTVKVDYYGGSRPVGSATDFGAFEFR
jgi:hypothetical protein